MAPGDITASTPVFASSEATIKTALDNLNLAAVTDNVHVIPWNNGCLIFKTERA